MSINNLVASAIYSKLTAGTVLGAGVGVYRNQATEGAVLPYAVFSLQAGGPQNINPSDLRDEVYFVRAYAAKAADAGAIDALASGALHKQTLTVTGYTNISTVRELDLELIENPPNGRPVFMCGGLYRISVDA
jgi:hypothetical protein